MERLPAFERDPWLRRLDTEVVASGDEGGQPWVVLADTVLYPEGGGQPADLGTVAGIRVLDVRRADGEIRHVLADASPAGIVTVELDWPRRFHHMQQHTAQHLITALAEDRFGWATTSFHLGPEMSDVELDVAAVDPEALAALEDAVAQQIRAARPVTARRVTPAAYADLEVRSRGLPEGHTGSIRLVEIEGVDLNTCGGTHCASTAELEAVKLLGTESVRGGTRVFFVAGTRLRQMLGGHHLRSARLRALLGVPDEELELATEARLQQLKDADRTVRQLEGELATAEARGLAAQPGDVLHAHWPERELPFLQAVARELSALAPARVAFLTAGQGDEGFFLISAGPGSDADVPALGRVAMDYLNGRGGGSGRLFQGKAGGWSRRDEAVAAVTGRASRPE